MTLVVSNEDRLPIMLNVQQQQQHHLQLHRHHGMHVPTTGPNQIHRGNVIVATSGAAANDTKVNLIQQQTQPQHGSCKRSKLYAQTTPYGTVPHQPASVARRNARERNRVKQVNNGFAELRERIPQSIAQALGGGSSSGHGGSRAGSKKLSKVETLRMAVEYIRSLQRLLEEHDGTDMNQTITSSTSPTSSMSSASSTCGSVTLMSEQEHCLGADMRLRVRGDLATETSHQHHYHHHHLQRQDASPPAFTVTACSEASSSPTPSFISEASSGGSQGYGTNNTFYDFHGKAEFYDHPMTPEDEELLDCITMWQESQST